MKVTIPIDILKNVVSRCIKFTNPKGLVQEFNYFYFTGDSLRATDGFVGIIQVMPVTFETDFMVPADLFTKPIQSLTKDVEIEVKDGNVIVKSGGFKTKFPVVNLNKERVRLEPPSIEVAKQFPIVLKKDKEPSRYFMKSLKQVYFSVCKDETKVGYRGVLFKESNGRKWFYSTDNYRSSRFELLEEESDPFFLRKEDWLVPDTLLSLVLEGEEPAAYCLEGEKIWLYYSDFLVMAKFPTAPFRDVGGFFERPPGLEKVQFNSTEVSESLSRLSFFATAYPYRSDVVVIPPDRLIFVVKGGDIEAVEEVSCKTLATGVFPVNVNYFKEAAEKTTEFYFADPSIYFYSPSGLESVLLMLEAKSAEDLLERFRGIPKIRKMEEPGARTETETKQEGEQGKEKHRIAKEFRAPVSDV